MRLFHAPTTPLPAWRSLASVVMLALVVHLAGPSGHGHMAGNRFDATVGQVCSVKVPSSRSPASPVAPQSKPDEQCSTCAWHELPATLLRGTGPVVAAAGPVVLFSTPGHQFAGTGYPSVAPARGPPRATAA
jgi:hypothetical protein